MSEAAQSQGAPSESEEESVGVLDRLKKKYKKQQASVVIDQPADVTDLALEKYNELKKNYNFVSFE